MSWSELASWLQRYRNALTLAIAGAVAVAVMLGSGLGQVIGSPYRAFKVTAFIFAAVGIPLALVLTMLLVVAEQRAKAPRLETELPAARALPKPAAPAPAVPAPAVPAPAVAAATTPATRAPVAVEPTPPGDEPSILR